jgi:transcriptional regulator with XRE-family HTH domain
MDFHIGKRVRLQRLARNMSQTAVADALGLTFQQIQKYENGKNRIGAGRLQELANLFAVPAAFFFEDRPRVRTSRSADQSVTDLLSKRDGLALAQAFDRIQNRLVRRHVVDLVEQLANVY